MRGADRLRTAVLTNARLDSCGERQQPRVEAASSEGTPVRVCRPRRCGGRRGYSTQHYNWLTSMKLSVAAELDRYIGYWKPYATSHEELDAETHSL
jgi:hypothetical protein